MGTIALQHSNSFYPAFGIPAMQGQKGYRWRDLVEWTSQLSGSDPHVMALVRTIRQIDQSNGERHADAHHDPFCALCAGEALANFKGSEDDLLVLYYRNLYDINRALTTMRQRRREETEVETAAIA